MCGVRAYWWMARLTILMTLGGLLAGCPSWEKRPAFSGSGMDMFTPVALRIHPLSRVATAGAAVRLQARLEFSDQMGDVGKGVGRIDLQLFEYQTLAPGHQGRPLGSWTIPLDAPAANHAHWDAITRTYLCDIPLADGLPQARYVLRAGFTLPNGDRLKDEAVLGGK